MRVLVTGGMGFIGTAVRSALMPHYETTWLDRAHDGVDIRDRDAVARAVKGHDVVVHLAGVLGTAELLDDLQTAIDVNVSGAANVLAACRDAEASFVGITMPDCWPSIYQATKLAATRIADAYRHAYGMRVVHVRTFNVYGPGQAYGDGHPQKILPTFAVAAHRRDPLPIWGTGENTVDLVHVDDVGATFHAVVENLDRFDGRVVDCGSCRQSRVLTVAADVCAAAGWDDPELDRLPMRVGETEATYLAADPRRLVTIPAYYRDDPRFVEAVEWYRRYA